MLKHRELVKHKAFDYPVIEIKDIHKKFWNAVDLHLMQAYNAIPAL